MEILRKNYFEVYCIFAAGIFVLPNERLANLMYSKGSLFSWVSFLPCEPMWCTTIEFQGHYLGTNQLNFVLIRHLHNISSYSKNIYSLLTFKIKKWTVLYIWYWTLDFEKHLFDQFWINNLCTKFKDVYSMYASFDLESSWLASKTYHL